MKSFSYSSSTRRVVRLGCLAAALSVAVDALAAWPRLAMVRGYAAEPLAETPPRPAERSFLQKASDAGRLQLRLAELGSTQATSAEVRGHAEQLKSDNRQLVDALTAVMQRKGVAIQAPANAAPPETYVRMAERSGAEFDREFVRVMAELHEDTITLFETAAAESKDTDVRDLAAAQLPMLRAHRNRITELKKTFD